MAWTWHGHGMASVNQTRPHCVSQMGKTKSKPLAARHGNGRAWARHGKVMLCVNRPLDDQLFLSTRDVVNHKYYAEKCNATYFAFCVTWELLANMVFSYTNDGKSNGMDSVAVCINIFLRCREKWPRCWRLGLTFRHRAFSILGQAFHYSPENAFYIFNQQIYFIIWYLLDRASLI